MKHISIIISVIISLWVCSTPIVSAQPLNITAYSAIVIEASTGKVLYEKNSTALKYPASTTKIMTLITALEAGNLDDTVTASSFAANTEGSSLSLTQGEQLKLSDILFGTMLVSGNDATVAVAEHIAGSVEKFAILMNEKAQAIGAANTHFTNPSGLPDPNHITTAHDLARITAYGYTKPQFIEIVSSKHKIIPWPGKGFDRELFNENRMLWLYEGANGVKTGYTDAAGRCLVSGAKRNQIQLITVVLDSERMWDDSIALLDYGFMQVKPQTIYNQGDILKTTKVLNGKLDTLTLVIANEIIAPTSNGDINQFSTVIEAPERLEAPIQHGQRIGVVKLLYQNQVVANAELLASQNVERRSLFAIVWNYLLSLAAIIMSKLH